MTKSQKIKRFVPPLVGCAIIFAMLWNLGLEELRTSLSNANPYLIVAAFFVSSSTLYVFRGIRWIVLFNKARPVEALKVMLVGLAINQVAPIGTGDLSRVYIAKRRLNIAAGETLASAAVERILDLTFLVAVSILFLLSLATGNGYMWQIIAPVLLLIAGYGLLFNPRFPDSLQRQLEKLKQKKVFSLCLGKISSSLSLDTFKNAMLELRGRRTLVLSILSTVAAWVIGGVAEYMILLAFGFKVPIPYVVSIFCVSWIIGAFSFLPGGLGAKEIGFAVLLNTQGVPLATGMWVSLIDRLIIYILLGSGAFASLLSFTRTGGEDNPKEVSKET